MPVTGTLSHTLAHLPPIRLAGAIVTGLPASGCTRWGFRHAQLCLSARSTPIEMTAFVAKWLTKLTVHGGPLGNGLIKQKKKQEAGKEHRCHPRPLRHFMGFDK